MAHHSISVEVYVAVRRLQRMVGFTYSFPVSRRRSLRHLALPEAQLLALIVVVTKLLFPFDEVKRYPTSAADPAAHVLDWKMWASTQRHFDSKPAAGGRLPKGNEILVEENDVFKMTTHQLDDYLDWYENSWLDSRGMRGRSIFILESYGLTVLTRLVVSNPLADMFPTGRTGVEGPADARVEIDEEDIDSKLRSVISQLRPTRVVPPEENLEDESILRPGSSYQFYRTESSLPETARIFYETAARLSGLSLQSLIRAVFQTELKVQQWQEDQRRAEYHGQYVDEGVPMEEDGMHGGDASADDMEIAQASDLE
jgi:RNA polymerase I-specific transcription initiation factor RRN7